MALFQNLLAVVKKRPSLEPPETYIKTPPSIVDGVAELQVDADGKKAIGFDDLGIIIEYQDSQGFESERRIRIKNFSKRGELQYINAYCFERKAPRCFKVENILAIIDADSGEVLSENAPLFFSDAIDKKGLAKVYPASVSQFPDAYNLCYRGIKALAYIARCDGHFHDLELGVIEKYCTGRILRANTVVEFDAAVFMEYARRQFPSFEDFERALTRIYKSEAERDLFIRMAHELIVADGVIDEEETLVASEIHNLFQQLDEDNWAEYSGEPYPY